MTSSKRTRWCATAGALLIAAAAVAGCGSNSGSSGGSGGSGGTVAFLMPDTGSTRYDLHDRPGFEKRLGELCSDCKPLYNNADGSADKQQQQFNSAVAQGAKVIVLDPVDSAAAASLVNSAKGQG